MTDMRIKQSLLVALRDGIHRLDVPNIINICEEYEIRQAAMPLLFKTGNANVSKDIPPIHLILLAAYLIMDDLSTARMLCKRLDPDIKVGAPP